MKEQIRVIKSQQEYEAALARLSALMDRELEPGSDAEAELELLALVIQAYERDIVPPVIPDPIEAILFRMDQQNLTQKDLVPYIGSISKVSEVLSRNRPLSLSMIRRLHKGLGIPADVLIMENDLRDEVDLAQDPPLDYTKFPLQEMQKRGLIQAARHGANELKLYAEELIQKFFRSIAPNKTGTAALLRASLAQNGSRAMDQHALLVWQMCVLGKSRAQSLQGIYHPDLISEAWLRDLVKLSSFERGPRLAQEYLNHHGIALVIERHFEKTYLDGAAMLDGNQPIIGMTLRHDRLDNFWFVLLHELMHVKKHLTPDRTFIADNLDDKIQAAEIQEKEADWGAAEALIPEHVWQQSAVATTHLHDDALKLARQLQIHPAIVAGRVRKETGNWRLLSGLISSAGKVEPLFEDQLSPV